jgi:putative glutathione S-transferase
VQINNGVYRAGFATTQPAYEAAERDVHEGMARANELLGSRRFLCGDTVTEADVRLLPTALRFDGVYATFFRCGRRQIRSDYPHIERWMKAMLRLDAGVLHTFNLDAARASYYGNLFPLNPGGIVPAGPTLHDLGLAGIDASPDPSAFAWR